MTKKEYIKAIKDFIGENGFMPFEHGYTSSIFLTHPKDNKLYQMWGLSDTQVFVRQRKTIKVPHKDDMPYSITSRISFYQLKANEVAEVYDEMMKYYNFVIKLNKQ